MTHKKTTPATNSRPVDLWSELDNLCKKTRYWLYRRKEKTKAKRYASRLEQVLGALPANDLAILRAEGLALLSELKGKIDEAIAHRQREIALMAQLHAEARSPKYALSTKSYMLRGRDSAALQERQYILEALQNGKLSPSAVRRPPVPRRA